MDGILDAGDAASFLDRTDALLKKALAPSAKSSKSDIRETCHPISRVPENGDALPHIRIVAADKRS